MAGETLMLPGELGAVWTHVPVVPEPLSNAVSPLTDGIREIVNTSPGISADVWQRLLDLIDPNA